MYRMFTSNKEASPLCRAERRSRAVGTPVRCLLGSQGQPGPRDRSHTTAPHPTLLIWLHLGWFPGCSGGFENKRHLPGGRPLHIYNIPNKHGVWLPSPALARGHQSKVLPGRSPRSLRTHTGSRWLKLSLRGGNLPLARPPGAAGSRCDPSLRWQGQRKGLRGGSGADGAGPSLRGRRAKQMLVGKQQFLCWSCSPWGTPNLPESLLFSL